MGFLHLSFSLCEGITIGFLVTVLFASVLDKFGDAMFRRGFAKPFYFKGHRLHHRSFLHVFLPLAYISLALMIVLGFVKVVWRLLLPGLATTLAIGVACLGFDLLWDRLSLRKARWGILHHEFIYLVVLAFPFTDFLKLAF
jgi:sterol desaturase/sphingolipid hydroxylase (fatty acid hydroxylase superfamily)